MQNGTVDDIKSLVRAGASPNVLLGAEYPATHRDVLLDMADTVQLLMTESAGRDITPRRVLSMHLATSGEHLPFVRRLVEHEDAHGHEPKIALRQNPSVAYGAFSSSSTALVGKGNRVKGNREINVAA